MNESASFWMILNILSLVILSFYSMMELACVSMNKVRLQYYVSKENPRAIKLHRLLSNSSLLFGTTLIGVNIALFFGSEFSRQFYSALSLSPDLAPLTQVMIVIIFGELAPMFAARRYAEHTAMLGANLLYFSSQIMAPFLWLIGLITRFTHSIFGGKDESFSLYLNQDEIKKVLEERQEELPTSGTSKELDHIVSNIFEFREKKAAAIMQPLTPSKMLFIQSTVKDLSLSTLPFVVVYHKEPTHVVGIAFPRDYLREPDHHKIGEKLRSPWFIHEEMPIIKILHQFKVTHQTVAVVLNQAGKAIGVVSLQDVIEEILGEPSQLRETAKAVPWIDLTFPADTKIADFNRQYNVKLPDFGNETLGELMIEQIGHQPEKGDSIELPPFELEVKEATLLEVKSIAIRTIPS